MNDTPDFLDSRAICSAREAIHVIAGVPLVELQDPYSGRTEIGDLAGGMSRWVVANQIALRARVSHGFRGRPHPTDEWRQHQRRERFTIGDDASLWSDDAVFDVRVRAMDRFCAEAGVSPADLCARLATHEAKALAYLDLRDSNNESLTAAARLLSDALTRKRTPMLCGRKVGTREFGVLSRTVFFDPATRWDFDPSVARYRNVIHFTGKLHAADADYEDLRMAVEDVATIPRAHCGAHDDRAARRPLRQATKEAVLALWHGARPSRLPERDRLILEYLRSLGFLTVSPKTIRTAIRELRIEGKLLR